MRDLITLLVHVVTTVLRVVQPGGVRPVIAESVLIKHQLLILNRSRRRGPNLCNPGSPDCGILFALDPAEEASSFGDRVQAVDISEFSSRIGATEVSVAVLTKAANEAGSKGADCGFDPGQAVLEMKRRNPLWGCPQIAGQINLALATSINKDAVRRILATHYPPTSAGGGP